MAAAVDWHHPHRRARGVDCPWRVEQVLTTAAYVVVTTIGFVVLAIGIADEGARAGMLASYAVCAAVTAACWSYIEFTDPALPGGVRCPCMRKTQDQPAVYCRICFKETPGLDHHCYFLHTDIGTRNYAHFYVMSIASSVQMVLHVVYTALALSVYRPSAYDDSAAYYTLLALQGIAAIAAGGSTFSLCGFHTYLLYIGMGTYDWIWWKDEEQARKQREANERQLEAQRRQRAQQRQAQAAAAAAAAEEAAAAAATAGSRDGKSGPASSSSSMSSSIPDGVAGAATMRSERGVTPGGVGEADGTGSPGPAEGEGARGLYDEYMREDGDAGADQEDDDDEDAEEEVAVDAAAHDDDHGDVVEGEHGSEPEQGASPEPHRADEDDGDIPDNLGRGHAPDVFDESAEGEDDEDAGMENQDAALEASSPSAAQPGAAASSEAAWDQGARIADVMVERAEGKDEEAES